MRLHKKGHVQERKRRIASQQVCPNCGLPKSEWKGNGGNGYSGDEATYYCQGCAVQMGCNCDAG